MPVQRALLQGGRKRSRAEVETGGESGVVGAQIGARIRPRIKHSFTATTSRIVNAHRRRRV
ncbi:hypothetical protein BST61_g9794 [Cercospora zeina]